MKEKSETSHAWAKWKQNKVLQFSLYAIFGIALYLLLLENVLPQRIDAKVGMVSKETIISPVTTIDEYATEQAKKQAMDSVGPQYSKDENITNQQIDRIDRMFVDIRRNITDPKLTEQEKIANLRDIISPQLSQEFYLKLVRTPPEQLTMLRLTVRQIVMDILSEGVRETELAEKKNLVDRELVTSSLDPDSRFIVRELARFLIIPNVIYDPVKTESLKKAAQEAVDPIPIQKGQVIVSKGEVITQDQYRKLKQLGLLKEESVIYPYIGLAMLIIILLSLMWFYIRRFHQEQLAQNNANVIMLFSIVLLCLISMKIVAYGQNLEWNTLGYLAPVAFGSMLITLLLDVKLALTFSVMLSICASIIFNTEHHFLFDFRYGLVVLVSSAAGAFALAGIHKRSAILFAGVLAALSSMCTILTLYFFFPSDGVQLFQSLGFGFASGILSAVLTIGFLPYYETFFDILSPLRLLELSNPNHPLLKKLLFEAPGTYHHSVIVANLAEAAAEAIGADGLLARVGAYYHDVGKTKRPQFFIENQLGKENPHDKISPNLSKTIIISHARDGVEMLKKYKIPKPIQDIAAQHHGTTLLKYFYYKALKQTESSKVLEEDYRYPGPKAQFKEAAIVGIADCVEAAVRSLSRPTPSRIEAMVRKIIQDRLEDGQFNECDLTLKELEWIAQSMCATLQGIFHNRIEYPEEQVRKGAKSG